MSLKHISKVVAGGVVAMMLGTVAASAAPAVASGNVNVRTGPGTNFAVVDTLRRGERVDIQQCRGSWCLVQKSGPNGWVSANYLTRTGPAVRPAPGWRDDYPRYRDSYPRYRNDWRWRGYDRRYPVRPNAQFCVGGSNASFCVSR